MLKIEWRLLLSQQRMDGCNRSSILFYSPLDQFMLTRALHKGENNLNNNNMKKVSSVFFLDEFARTMYFITITWVLFQLTKDAFYTGLLTSLGFLPGLITNLIFGVVVDRFDRKRLILISNVISMVAVLFITIETATGILSAWSILIVQMVIQTMGSLFRPAIQAFTAENFKREELPKVFSQTGIASILGGLLGASVGGIILALTSPVASLVFILIIFLIGALAINSMKSVRNSIEMPSDNTSIIAGLIDGFSYLKANLFLFRLFGVMFVGMLVFHSTLAFLSVYTKDYFGQTATVYGFMHAALSAGGILAGILGTWWWNIKYQLSTSSLLVVAVGLLIVGLTPWIPLAFIGIFIIGLGTTWIRVLLQSQQQMTTDKSYHGRMASFRMLFNQVSVVISGPILGWFANDYGANSVYLVLIVPVGIATILTLKKPVSTEIDVSS